MSTRQNSLFVLALLVVFLAGCGGSVTPSISDETQNKKQNRVAFCSNISKRLGISKKLLLSSGSEAYLYAEQAEATVTSLPQYDDAIIWVAAAIHSIDIRGNEATVDLDIWVQIYFSRKV